MEPFDRLAAQGAMIERLTADSRRCAPGTAFFAYPGEKADGRNYIGDALARGAAAVVWEANGFQWRNEWRIPNLAILGLKQRAGVLASDFNGRPSEHLWMCGVTGTNGKTSCSQWIAAALGHHGVRAGVVGTLGTGFPGALREAGNTTPDALELQATLRELRNGGARAVAMEVSSHGLVQGRVNGVRFSSALFTNLSHDHLDYHGTMQAYGEAKAQLFLMDGLQSAVLNLDDPFGRELARRLAGRVRTIGYSLQPIERGVVDGAISVNAELALESSWGKGRLASRQVGRFNVSNILGVVGVLIAHGLQMRDALALVADLPDVPGRMEVVGDRPLIVVDYAHTPDALEKVLATLRPVAVQRKGRLIVVFGAGGDRDPAKRPVMGRAASRGADLVFITSDNPRSEDPAAIIAAVARGTSGTPRLETDRKLAIEAAVLEALPKDVVLIAGKGHESYQEIRGNRQPFSDQAVARAALTMRGKQ
ncbi:MAG: UDP-N-acetylmuramoyl-L-alanyl-D-glutamate--2,6-diaminopimelate ligase [Betaproteobacteria bacterium]|nr:UDP-N-acetylmuramoyl-L-alanyl-D-glutamate--2,6-diaminopimelate ligase [Betaproteobacteria bacterium]